MANQVRLWLPGLQTGQLDAQAGVAGGGEALVADQYSNQVDQNRRTADTPRQEAVVAWPTTWAT